MSRRGTFTMAGLLVLLLGTLAWAVSVKLGVADLPNLAMDSSLPEPDSDRRTQPHIALKAHVGTLLPGSTHQVPFRLKNETDRAWEIIETRTSCGCLSATVDAKQVAPGEDLTGVATVRASLVSQAEPYISYVEMTLGGQKTTILLEFQGTIEPLLSVVPGHLRFIKETEAPDEMTQHLTISGVVPENAQLESQGNIPEWIRSVEITKRNESEPSGEEAHTSGWDVVISYAPAKLRVAAHGKLDFGIVDDGKTTTSVPYQVVHPPRETHIFPSQLFFGTIPVGETVRRSVVLQLSAQQAKQAGPLHASCTPGLSKKADCEIEIRENGNRR